MSFASCFLETLKFILCCLDERRHGDGDDDNFYVPISNSYGNLSTNTFSGASTFSPQQSDFPTKTQRLGERQNYSIRREPIPQCKDQPTLQTHGLVLVSDASSVSSPSKLPPLSSTSTAPPSSHASLPSSNSSAINFSDQQKKLVTCIRVRKGSTGTNFCEVIENTKVFARYDTVPDLQKPQGPVISAKPSISSPQTLKFCPKPSFSSPKPSSSSSLFDDEQRKEDYAFLRNDSLPIYRIPKNIEDLIKKDIVPGVLRKPLTYSTYKDYFAALLYAEDYYIEKWSGFELKGVTLELCEEAVRRSGQNKQFISETVKRKFVKFDIDSLIKEEAFNKADNRNEPCRRPFLLSRDFVIAQPLGRKVEPFKGVVNRVQGRGIVRAEFGEDFLSQHSSKVKYDISFSFNRVCFKRAHKAISDASDLLFRHFLFPENVSKRDMPDLLSCFRYSQLLSVQGIPHLIEGPPSIQKVKCADKAFDSDKVITDIGPWELTTTGEFIVEAVLHAYQRHPESRFLICAPTNLGCDLLISGLKKYIPEYKMFRANAAFRGMEEVTAEILPSCLYEGECFACPPLEVLKEYRVISSTFMSSYRLHKEGIVAGYFDFIFLVDASSATEPESLVTLANFANHTTVVVATGVPGQRPRWVRSDIARKNGLKISYFERLWCDGPSISGKCQSWNKLETMF